MPAPEITFKPPFDRWTYRVLVTTPEPLKIKEGTVAATLGFSGTGSPLAATGSITFAGIPAGNSYVIGKLESGTWHFDVGSSYLVAHLAGKLLCEDSVKNYEGYFVGPPDQLASTFWGQQPEDEALIHAALTPGLKPLPAEITTVSIDLGPMVYNPQLAAEIQAKQQAPTVSDSSPTPPPPPP